MDGSIKVKPASSGATSNSSGYSQTEGFRKQPSRSCKSGVNPRSAAPIANLSMDKQQLNHRTASLVFCALAYSTFMGMIIQGDPKWIYPVSYLFVEPNGNDREEWLGAKSKEL